jgi:hypothetical protein
MAKFLGTVVVQRNGKIEATMEGVEIDTGGVERAVVMINGRPGGYSEKGKVPMIKCKIGVDVSFDTDELNSMTNGTVIAEGDNGVMWQLDEAWTSQPVTIATEGAGATVEFQGKKMRQLGLSI